MNSIKAITFGELVEYGKEHGANIVNDMPWSFTYEGVHVSHENDDCYIIGIGNGVPFRRGNLLVHETVSDRLSIWIDVSDVYAAAAAEVRARKQAMPNDDELAVQKNARRYIEFRNYACSAP